MNLVENLEQQPDYKDSSLVTYFQDYAYSKETTLLGPVHLQMAVGEGAQLDVGNIKHFQTN